MTGLRSLDWVNGQLVLLDQTRLPNEIVYETYDNIEDLFDAIQRLKVRGAPAIGVAAAYGVVLGVRTCQAEDFDSFFSALKKVTSYLAKSRPTAVNLFWALDRMEKKAVSLRHLPVPLILQGLEEEAISIHKEDTAICRQIGVHLLTLLKDGMTVMTHCNAGALATTKYGTATSPIYLAKEQGWNISVYACETRPLLQGSRLTALELTQAGINVTLITDNMAGMVMSQGKIDAVIVGCDRIAANGDTANKIGTFSLSVLAKYFDIPFYVAAPTPTIDLATETGSKIPIEERDPLEIIKGFGAYTAPKNIKAYNPAFDVTPWQNITAIITEKGIVMPPYQENLKKLFE